MDEIKAGERLDFRNGWTIDIHAIRNGEVLYRKWTPGIERQSLVANLGRMPLCDFVAQAKAEKLKNG